MTNSFKPKKGLIFTMSFVYGFFAALFVFLLGGLAVFGYQGSLEATSIIALRLARDEAAANRVATFAESHVVSVNSMMLAVVFAAVVIGLAVWLMYAVDERMEWRRNQPARKFNHH